MNKPNVEVLTNTEKLVLKAIAEKNGLATFGIIMDTTSKSEDAVFKAIGKMICFKLIESEIVDGKASFSVKR